MYPAGESGIRVRYASVDGMRLRVLESGPANGAGVVLLHGWGACVYSFDAMIPALAGAGYRVVTFDLPGHGLSDKPLDPALYTIESLVRVVQRIATDAGLQRYSVVGHSMGAAMAVAMARHPSRTVDRIALIGPVGVGRAPFIVPVRLLSPRVVEPITPAVISRTTIELVLRFGSGGWKRPKRRDVDQYWAPSQFDEYAKACRICAHSFNWRATPATVLRSIRVPTLVVSGTRDRIVFGALQRARLIPTARIVSIRKAGHIVLQESSERVNAELIDFLRSRTA